MQIKVRSNTQQWPTRTTARANAGFVYTPYYSTPTVHEDQHFLRMTMCWTAEAELDPKARSTSSHRSRFILAHDPTQARQWLAFASEVACRVRQGARVQKWASWLFQNITLEMEIIALNGDLDVIALSYWPFLLSRPR